MTKRKMTELRNCFEAGMDLELALECVGLTASEQVFRLWERWTRESA
jgi:hypothetical protein